MGAFILVNTIAFIVQWHLLTPFKGMADGFQFAFVLRPLRRSFIPGLLAWTWNQLVLFQEPKGISIFVSDIVWRSLTLNLIIGEFQQRISLFINIFCSPIILIDIEHILFLVVFLAYVLDEINGFFLCLV